MDYGYMVGVEVKPAVWCTKTKIGKNGDSIYLYLQREFTSHAELVGYMVGEGCALWKIHPSQASGMIHPRR